MRNLLVIGVSAFINACAIALVAGPKTIRYVVLPLGVLGVASFVIRMWAARATELKPGIPRGLVVAAASAGILPALLLGMTAGLASVFVIVWAIYVSVQTFL